MRQMLEGQTVESKVLNCDLYIKPVDKVIDDINNFKSDKVILTGVRGSGKSTVLLKKSYESIYTDIPSMYVRFDGLGVFYGNVDEKFPKELYVHYYEIKMALEILNFVKVNFESCYDSYFKNLYFELDNFMYELNHYGRYGYRRNDKIKIILYLGEYVEPLLKRLKDKIGVKGISLMLDRFDSVNNSREISQSILSEYFKLFEKVILVSDDKNTLEEVRQQELKSKGYDTYVVNYGASLDDLRGILKDVIVSYNFKNSHDGYIFPYSSITDELLEECIKKCNGNITFVLNALRKVNFMLGHIDVYEYFMRSLDKQIERQNEVDKMYPKKILHL